MFCRAVLSLMARPLCERPARVRAETIAAAICDGVLAVISFADRLPVRLDGTRDGLDTGRAFECGSAGCPSWLDCLNLSVMLAMSVNNSTGAEIGRITVVLPSAGIAVIS
jgi:hypothetical protein